MFRRNLTPTSSRSHLSFTFWWIFFLTLTVGNAAMADKPTPQKLIPFPHLIDWGFSLEKRPQFTDLEEALKNPKLRKATKMLGQTRINLSKLPYSSGVLDSGKKAWSSWWYPKIDKDFVSPKDPFRVAILKKYDQILNQSEGSKSALTWETQREDRLVHSTWEGLCDAWAIASILHPEPQAPKTFKIKTSQGTSDLTLSIFDLKGLLIKTYEATPEDQFEFYGEKFTGNINGWIHPDLFPDQFHRLVDMYLGELKTAFIMDRDPGPEVWSVPVYKANYKIEAIPNKPDSVLVRMWLYTAGPANSDEKEMVGTKEVLKEYQYILSGERDPSGQFLNVNRGEWIKSDFIDSRVNHPDFIFVPKVSRPKRGSYNPNIDPKQVDRLLEGASSPR